MHTTQFPALFHRIFLCVTVLRLQRPEVRIPPAAPRAASEKILLFLFCMKLCTMLQGADSNSLCLPSASRRAKTVLWTVFKARLGESPRPHKKRSLYCITVIFFISLGSVLANPLLTLRGNIGHGTHEKTDKIAHGISFPCWFCTSGRTRAILSVFVFV